MKTMKVTFANGQEETSMKWLEVSTIKDGTGNVSLVSYRQRQRVSVEKKVKKGDKFTITFEELITMIYFF